MNKLPILAVLFALTACAPTGPPAPEPEPAPEAALDPALATAVDSLAEAALRGEVEDAPALAGLAVGIARNGEPVHLRGYGLADAESGTAVTERTVFRIGSVTKPFTAAAVMRLVEAGDVALDDDIREHLPDAPTRGRSVTVRQLLDHTSGIPSYTNRPGWFMRTGEPITHDEMLAEMAADSLDFEPGAEQRYNNSGYYLLGLLIEAVTGEEYADHLQRVFFAPLGLADTGYCPDEPSGEAQARGYRVIAEEPVPALPVSMTHPYAAGALCSTVGDLLQWRQALDSGEVVEEASLREMVRPTVTTAGDSVDYGLGLAFGDRSGHPVVGHQGGIHGFISQWNHYPEDGWTVTVLTNTEGQGAMRVEDAIARRLLGIPEPERVELSTEERAVYLGIYDIGILEIRIFEENDRLMAQATGQPSFPLRPEDEHEFGAVFDPSLRLLFEVEANRATALTLHQGGQSFTGERVD